MRARLHNLEMTIQDNLISSNFYIEPGTYVFWQECCFCVQVVSAEPLTRSFSLPVIIAMRIMLIAILRGHIESGVISVRTYVF